MEAKEHEVNIRLRAQKRAMREAMSEAERVAASTNICHKMWEAYHTHPHAGVFLSYYPMRNEADLVNMHENLLSNGHELYFPAVEGDEIRFYFAQSPADFSRGTFGIMEPTERNLPYDESENAICFVPGVVFSEKGDRIGFGKGYYDRFFAAHPDVWRVGICYEAQLSDEIVAKETDVPMHTIITEKRIIHISDR